MPPPPPPPPISRRSINLASASDGASVLAANPEAKRPERTIDGDIDSFMKNDCSATKWMVVELAQVRGRGPPPAARLRLPARCAGACSSAQPPRRPARRPCLTVPTAAPRLTRSWAPWRR